MAYDKLSNYKTTWTNNDGVGSVIYEETAIVSWMNNKITLRSGGWKTATTKKKMNQASHQFNLGYRVYQVARNWFVDLPDGDTVWFTDGMTFEGK